MGRPVRVRRKGDVFKVVYYPTGLVGEPATRKTCPGAWKTPEEAEDVAAVLRHHLREHRARNAGGRKTALTLLSALDAYVGELERQVDSVVVPYGTMKTRRSHLNLCVRPAAEHEPRPQVRDLPGDMARQLVNGIADSRKKDGSLEKAGDPPRRGRQVERVVEVVRGKRTDRRRALRRPPQRGERRTGSHEGKKREEGTMSARDWEKRVLAAKGAEERVTEIEQELLLASRLTALREGAGLSQRELAMRLPTRPTIAS